MKYLHSFNSYSVEENIDMSLIPIDVTKGISLLVNDAFEKIKSLFSHNYYVAKKGVDKGIDLNSISTDEANNYLNNFYKYFGFTSTEATYEKIYNSINNYYIKIQLDTQKTNENLFNKTYDPMNESIVHKVINILRGIFLFNSITLGVVAKFVFLIFGCIISFYVSILVSVLAFIILTLVKNFLYKINLY